MDEYTRQRVFDVEFSRLIKYIGSRGLTQEFCDDIESEETFPETFEDFYESISATPFFSQALVGYNADMVKVKRLFLKIYRVFSDRSDSTPESRYEEVYDITLYRLWDGGKYQSVSWDVLSPPVNEDEDSDEEN